MAAILPHPCSSRILSSFPRSVSCKKAAYIARRYRSVLLSFYYEVLMATPLFAQIQQSIHHKKPFKADYTHQGAKPGTRVLCPHVIGHRKKNSTANSEERVLCFQTAGPDPNTWHSFELAYLNVTDWNPPDPWVTPPNYNQYQSNVHDVAPGDHVPYP